MASDLLEKISFSVHIPLLTRATADNEEQVSGYMLTEIETITFQPHLCEQLGEYLSRRLTKPSYFVKLKVLKIMLHLIRNGHIDFRKYLRTHDSPIKAVASFNGPPHPLLGTSPYESVRKSSQELLETLFDPDLVNSDEGGETKSSHASESKVQMGGLGSSVKSKGKYEGFGNSPYEKEETVKDKAMDILIKLIHPSDDSTEMIKQALTSNSGEYEPVKIESSVCNKSKCITFHDNEIQKVQIKKAHVPGRAGGGWESDEEEKNFTRPKELHSSNSDSNLSIDSLERVKSSNTEDVKMEKQLVFEYCNLPTSPSSQWELNEVCKRFPSLNSIDVVTAIKEFLADSLSTNAHSNETKIMRALLIIEWFLRTDVPIKHYSQFISPKLCDIISVETNVKPEIKTKAQKLKIIIEKLELRN